MVEVDVGDDGGGGGGSDDDGGLGRGGRGRVGDDVNDVDGDDDDERNDEVKAERAAGGGGEVKTTAEEPCECYVVRSLLYERAAHCCAEFRHQTFNKHNKANATRPYKYRASIQPNPQLTHFRVSTSRPLLPFLDSSPPSTTPFLTPTDSPARVFNLGPDIDLDNEHTTLEIVHILAADLERVAATALNICTCSPFLIFVQLNEYGSARRVMQRLVGTKVLGSNSIGIMFKEIAHYNLPTS
ncbi:hypothetical protein R3P38DRAFT_3611688 [Favolaschia claudopus]|uniref:Uncharacterized protein n=1 Tax=Favolaschia claudopus TaxID=2862362 RepID=A0AAW0A530_9AGAR